MKKIIGNVRSRSMSTQLNDDSDSDEDGKQELENTNKKMLVLAVGQNILGKYGGQWYRGRVTARQPKTGKGYTGIYSIKFQHSRTLLKLTRSDLKVQFPIIEVPDKKAEKFLSQCKQYQRGATPSPVPPESGVHAEQSPDSKAETSTPDWASNAFSGDPFADIDPPVLGAKVAHAKKSDQQPFDFDAVMMPIAGAAPAQPPKPQMKTPQKPQSAMRRSRRRTVSSPVPLVQEKVIVIVGVGNGLSLAVAEYFISHGFAVVLMSHSKDKLKPVHEKIVSIGGKVRSIIVNTSEAERVAGAFNQLKKGDWVSKISVLFYNPEFASPSAFDALSAEDFCKQWRSSTLGAFLVTQQVLPVMLNGDGGTVLILGHSTSLRPEARHAAASVGSAGVRALSQSLAAEYGPKGVHFVHVIVHAGTPSAKPDAVAATLYSLHAQDRSVWTSELELRPF